MTTQFTRNDVALDEVYQLLQELIGRLQPSLEQQLETWRQIEVSERQFQVLALIADRGPLSATEIAKLWGVDHAWISRMKKELVLLGLIRQEVDAQNAKRILLHLTDEGCALLESFPALGDHVKGALRRLQLGERYAILDVCRSLLSVLPDDSERRS